MAREWLIVPIFIPNQGCPYRCVFCNQYEISGVKKRDGREIVERAFQTYFKSWSLERLPPHREAAFYGGSFTGLPPDQQADLLSTVRPWIDRQWIHSIRVSTHPLFIDRQRLALLKNHEVRTIELGLQSTDEEVLRLSGRDCAMEKVVRAVDLIRESRFRLGLQLMPGLPGDTEKTFQKSVEETIALRPDFVRLYPTVVIRHTRLYRMYKQKKYSPWDLKTTLEALKWAVVKFRQSEIPIIRLGLHPDPSMLKNYVAGPYHPALRYLVDCRIALDQMIDALKAVEPVPEQVTFKVPAKWLSVYKGHKKENVRRLKEMFFLRDILFEPKESQNKLELAV